MSYVDFNTEPRDSVSDRLQDLWDHPRALSLIGMISRGVHGVKNLMDYARILSGPPPSTEEEAYRYNWARDHAPVAAFNAASLFNPAAPRGAGGIFARPVSGPASATRELTASNFREPSVLPATLPRALRPASEAEVSAVAGAGLKRSPIDTRAPQGGLLARLRELDEAEARPLDNGGSESVPAPLDPNLRQLTRVPSNLRASDSPRPEAIRVPLPEIESPPLSPGEKPVPRTDERSSGSGGSDGGGGGSDDNKKDRDRECNEQWQEEKYACREFLPVDALCGTRHERECEDRAVQRLGQCFRGEPQREKFSMSEVDPECVRRFLKVQRGARRKKRP